MAESEKELKSLLTRVKEESEKTGLKHNIQKTKIMPPGPINSWQTEGEKVKTVIKFIFLSSKISGTDFNQKLKDACSWKESFDKPRQCIKKQRHHFPDQELDSQSYVFQ